MKLNPAIYLSGLLLSLLSLSANAADVLVFTDIKHPLVNDGGHSIIYLDEVIRVERELSESISGIDIKIDTDGQITPEQLNLVRQQVRQGLKKHNIADAYAGLSMAWSLGITHIPAVVYNGKVVYGISDIDAALQILNVSDSGS